MCILHCKMLVCVACCSADSWVWCSDEREDFPPASDAASGLARAGSGASPLARAGSGAGGAR